jgi:hypothetical protein
MALVTRAPGDEDMHLSSHDPPTAEGADREGQKTSGATAQEPEMEVCVFLFLSGPLSSLTSTAHLSLCSCAPPRGLGVKHRRRRSVGRLVRRS